MKIRLNRFLLVALIAASCNLFIYSNHWWWAVIASLLAFLLVITNNTRWIIVCFALFAGLAGWFALNWYLGTMKTNTLHSWKCTISEIHNGYVIVKIDFFHHLYLDQQETSWRLGDVLYVKGYASNLPGNENSYEFDFSEYLRSNGICYQLHLADFIHKSTHHWYETMEDYLFGQKEYDIANGMLSLFLLGEHGNNVADLYNNFVDLNLIHLLIISGYHINVLFMGIERIFKRIFRMKMLRWAMIVIILFLYLFFLNFKLTAFKAIILIAIRLFGEVFTNKRISAVNQCAVALLCTIALYPFSFMQANVLYGFTITLGLGVCFARMRHLNYFWKIVCINLIIYALAMGWNIYYNFQIDLTSILFNILLMPVISFVYLFLWIIVWIAPLHFVCYYLYLFLLSYTDLLKDINLIFHIGKVEAWMVMLYYALLFAMWKWKHKRYFYNFFACIVLVVAFNFGFWVAQPLYTITMLDVGNANAIVIRDFRHWTTVLFDAGSGRGYSKRQVGDYLKSVGINYISTVFISHYHADHFNNYDAIKQQFWINRLIDNNSLLTTININDMAFEILNNNSWHSPNENDNSLLILLKLAKLKVVLTGDATALVENKMLKNQELTNVDMLQVGHHGSSTSSTYGFIHHLSPKICFVSGKDDGVEDFPTQQTLDTLYANHCLVYQTNKLHNLEFVIKRNYFFEIHNF